jgi:hypothetical protein
MIDVEHLRAQEKKRYDCSRDRHDFAESEAADRPHWPGQQVNNIKGRKTENQRNQDVEEVVGALGENQRLKAK